jgi:hypothetical protein
MKGLRFLPVLLLYACARGEITLPPSIAFTSLTVDATTSRVYVDLAAAAVVKPADPTQSSAWDIALDGASVQLNDGAQGLCLCESARASDAQVLALTPADADLLFDSISANDVPAPGGAWTADAFSKNSWYRANISGNGVVTPTYDVYLIRRGSVIYKLQVLSYYGPADQPGVITLRYARFD